MALGALLTVLLTLALLATPPTAEAQVVKVYRVGYLTTGDGVEEVFRQALRGFGYVEGQNLVIEGRFAQRKLDRLPELAADLVRVNVDVIVTITTPAALAGQEGHRDDPHRYGWSRPASRARACRKPGTARRERHRGDQ